LVPGLDQARELELGQAREKAQGRVLVLEPVRELVELEAEKEALVVEVGSQNRFLGVTPLTLGSRLALPQQTKHL